MTIDTSKATWSLPVRTRELLSGSAAVLLLAGVCRADVDGAIARCAASESKDARIACLEDALLSASRTAAPATAAVSPQPPEAPRPPASPGPPGSPEPPPAPESPRAPASAQHASVPPDATFGAEQVQDQESREDEVFRARVVDYDFVGYRRLLVKLDNGQVWQQIKGDRITVDRGLRDETTFDVELWKARLGGYRMRVTPVDRIIRVERLK